MHEEQSRYPDLESKRRDDPSPTQRPVNGVRALLSPLLLAGALVLPSFSPPPASSASDDPKDKQEQKAEDPWLAALRKEVTNLITDLDDDRFPVRQRAQQKLQDLVVTWVKTKEEPFPLESLLTNLYPSLEQKRRLERVYEPYDQVKVKLLWKPTRFAVPAEWNGRKTPPSAQEVLHSLEKQMHAPFTLYGKDEEKILSETLVPSALEAKSFWDAMVTIHTAAKKNIWIDQREDHSVRLRHHERISSAMQSSGSILATLNWNEQGTVYLNCCAEPTLILSSALIKSARGTTDKGATFTIPFNHMHEPSGHHMSTLPYLEGSRTADLTFVVELQGYRPKVVPVPLQGEKTLQNPSGEMRYKGMGKIVREFGDPAEAWQVRGTHASWTDRRSLFRCQASKKDGTRAQFHGMQSQWEANDSGYRYEWEFLHEPASVQFLVPERLTSTTMTFHFEGISLPQQPPPPPFLEGLGNSLRGMGNSLQNMARKIVTGR